MGFNRPTLQDINDRIQTDFQTRLSTAGAFLRRSVILVIGRVLAGASHLLHGHLDFISNQVLPDTAVKSYLERWASIWGIRKKPATFARGGMTLTGTNGSLIPARTLFVRNDGAEYESQADATIANGSVTIAIQALQPGSNGEAAFGVELTLLSPIAGVNSTGLVNMGGLSGGNDEETPEELRNRLLERIQQPPLGGADQDYRFWAKSVPGVTRVWVYEEYLGPGTVGITFVRDNDNPIIPDATEVQEVADYIETVRPVTAHVTVFAPIPDPIHFTISIFPDTPEIRRDVTAELADMIYREAQPGGTVILSHMNEAISIAKGEVDHTLHFPVADVVSSIGHLPQMGTITWV